MGFRFPSRQDRSHAVTSDRDESVKEFWNVLVRRWRTGATTCVLCVIAGAIVGIMSPPLYQAVALFQVFVPHSPVDPASSGNPVPYVGVQVIQDWLGDTTVLERTIDLAAVRGQVSVARLHRNAAILPAGAASHLESAAADRTSNDARRLAEAVARAVAEQSKGAYEVSVRDTSADRAQRLADALAQVLGERIQGVVDESLASAIARVRKTAAKAQALALARSSTVADPRPQAGERPGDAARPPLNGAAVEAYHRLEIELVELEALRAGVPSRVTFLAHASIPATPVTPGWGFYLAFGIIIGVTAGLGAALVHDSLSKHP